MTLHNEVVRESFTVQAKAFAANPWVTDEERIRRLVAAARLRGNERVLDIATGPGYIAEAFARAAREVIGVDHDLSGTRPFRDEKGQLHFHARTVTLTGRRFRVLP